MFTRCAHCESWLGISAEQLRLGLGQVRCGNCTQIFNALIYLSETPPSPPQLEPLSAARGQTALKADDATPISPVRPATFQIVPDVQPPAGFAAQPSAELDGPSMHAPMHAQPAPDSELNSAADATVEGYDDDARDDGTHDEGNSDADERDTASAQVASAPPAAGDGGSSRVSADTGSTHHRASALETDAQAVDSDPVAEAKAGETHVDPDADVDAQTLEKLFHGPVVAREGARSGKDSDLLAGVAQISVDPEDSPRVRHSAGNQVAASDSPIPTVLQADYARLHARRPSALVRALVIILCVLALLALPLQYAWFEPQDLVARYPQARPYVSAFCSYAQCAQILPEDRSKIALLGRDVRIHPRFEGALQIQATIINRGNYAQTYPQLRFTLFNDNGNVIAARQFTPAEYLRRSDVNLLRLQPGQTSQIQLDLIAPEDTAVSFEFEFI